LNPRSPRLVTIVDDDDAVRDSMALLLRLRGFEVRAFASGEEFLAAVDDRWHGCLLLDLRMPGISGLDVQAKLRERGLELPVVMLTAHGDAASARAALKAGAFDFIEKPADDAALVATLESATAADDVRRARAAHDAEMARRITRLTPREREVLEHVVRGRHNREIAASLNISPRTVEVYKARLMDKLQVDRLADLVRLALEAGLDTDTSGKPVRR
jgi:RNA polymerase sigma factor (sigma-70 family)